MDPCTSTRRSVQPPSTTCATDLNKSYDASLESAAFDLCKPTICAPVATASVLSLSLSLRVPPPQFLGIDPITCPLPKVIRVLCTPYYLLPTKYLVPSTQLTGDPSTSPISSNIKLPRYKEVAPVDINLAIVAPTSSLLRSTTSSTSPSTNTALAIVTPSWSPAPHASAHCTVGNHNRNSNNGRHLGCRHLVIIPLEILIHRICNALRHIGAIASLTHSLSS
ncbi:hypothetical protein V8C37DRAFT_230635 [Trichoderma ceciliae]